MSQVFNQKIKETELNGRSLGPIVSRIMNVHEKNICKQMKAQNTNQKMVIQYTKRKNKFENKMRERQVEVTRKIEQNKKSKTNLMKKQSKHVQEILQKFRKLDQQRYNNKLQKIKKRNLSSHKPNMQKKQAAPFFDLTQQQQNRMSIENSGQKKGYRNISNSLDLTLFYNKNFQRANQFAQSLLKKSIQRQQKAQQNRRYMRESSKIKEINVNKLLKKKKSDQSYQNKQTQFLKKSITKLQLFDKRNQQNLSSQRKKSQQKAQRNNKVSEQLRKKREVLQLNLQQKLVKFEKLIEQKGRKHSQNKQNRIQAELQNKISKRIKKTQTNQANFHHNRQQFSTKMTDMYKKDREHWGFLTSIGQFKQTLIEKNIYQSSQLSLLK